jgi:ABC-type phosphate transport system substrate-binding protein
MLRRFLFFLFFALLPATVSAESIVVVVNPESGVESLSRNEVINIFLGRFRQFPTGNAALPIDLSREDPIRREFYQRLVGKTPSEINSYWSRLILSGKTRPPLQVERVEDARALIRGSVSAIAYLERSQVNEQMRIVFELPL